MASRSSGGCGRSDARSSSLERIAHRVRDARIHFVRALRGANTTALRISARALAPHASHALIAHSMHNRFFKSAMRESTRVRFVDCLTTQLHFTTDSRSDESVYP